MAQRAPTRVQQSAPAEVLASLNLGVNGYTDPTLCNPRQWSGAQNVYSGAFGFVQRARFANLVSQAQGWTPLNAAFTTLKFYAAPGIGNYLLGDINNTQYSFDTGNSYTSATRPEIGNVFGATPDTRLAGPWSREILQNIVYEMNGQVKQTGRGANALTVENLGLNAPDVSPQVVISAGSSQNITNIQRSNGTVTVTLAGALTVPGGNNIGMVNVTVTSGDTSFAGTFLLLTGSGTTTLTWQQFGQNTTLLTPTGTVNVSITKSVGRSYSYAWENVNKNHVGAPSPVTQFIQYNAQNGQVQLIEQGTVQVTNLGTAVVGTGTAFTSAWVRRGIWIQTTSGPFVYTVASVTDATHLTLAQNWQGASGSGNFFQIYDVDATHLRLYETGDGAATYFRTQRNAFSAISGTLLGSGLQFFDNGQSEPPSFPFTTEISQLFNVPPPVGSFIKEYQQRLLVFGGTIPGQTFFYSNIESTSIGLTQESFAPLNQITLPIQNANISGMADLPGSLIIWSDKQDMFRLTGLLSDNTPLGLAANTANTAVGLGTSLTALPYNLGCANPFAVAVTPLGAIWVSSNRELWLFTDKYAPRNIGRPIQNILRNILPTQMANIRLTYYHSLDRNWLCISLVNGAGQNNILINLDLDLLASNGQPSFFTFDMATNHPAFWVYSINCPAMEVVYETGGAVRLLVGSTDLIQDADYQSGLFGTETPVMNAFLNTHAWGNDTAFMLKRPGWFRFTTNQDPSLLALQGWSFAALGIDDDFYTFASPLVLTLTPGVNDTSSLSGNPNLNLGEAFRHSPELFRIGGVNFVMGRRIEFIVNFPSGTGVNYALRTIQIGFGASPPR